MKAKKIALVIVFTLCIIAVTLFIVGVNYSLLVPKELAVVIVFTTIAGMMGIELMTSN
jgi:hypothetical protein